MIVEITRSYRYDPESVEEGERLYREASARVIMKELERKRKEKENDKVKEDLATNNNISNYIIIDCRYSDMEWIKKSIMKRTQDNLNKLCLAELLNFDESDIDWIKCHQAGCKNIVKEVCNLWNEDIKNVTEISTKLKISKDTTRVYLKQGTELGWCDYDPKEELRKSANLARLINNRKIICLTTGEVFYNIVSATILYKLNKSGIVNCCKTHYAFSGKHPITNEPLEWQYYDEYIKSNPIPLETAI